MEFRIADTFTTSLARLTSDEQKAAKTAAFDLQLNPAQPSLQFHRLDRAKDQRFWSIRVNLDLRIIVHRSDSSLLLCYVAHHDPAYQWAERRKLETHPKTGAAQLVEVRETVVEIPIPKYVEELLPAPRLFARYSDDDLLACGVPPEWLSDVRQATESSLLALADHLPAEAAEALLDLATGSPAKRPTPVALTADPFQHPDALRRFRVMGNVEELARALDYPWEKWIIFLHPAQRQLVERLFPGPARVSGTAGTGKTIVAIHRAAFLARSHPNARVLLTTFSDALASTLHLKLRALLHHEPRLGERIEVHSMAAIARRLYQFHIGTPRVAPRETVRALLEAGAQTTTGLNFSARFLHAEWDDIVDAWQLDSWEAYRTVNRLGRKTRLTENQRKTLWPVFASVRAGLADQGLVTESSTFSSLAGLLQSGAFAPPFQFAVVDEAQDIGIAQLRFLAALAGNQPNGLFFAGDLGQRIFQAPFSWKALGIDIRGRSTSLKINYRTSHQIRQHADRLLMAEVTDVDGNAEQRTGTVSLFNGPQPTILVEGSERLETKAVSEWLKARIGDGLKPHEIGVFVRSTEQFARARAAVEAAGLPCHVLDHDVDARPGSVSLSTMHLAKGLEFRAVAVMACDDDVIPLPARISAVVDEADLDEIYSTERHLLYVACTRARDHLLVTATDPGSEFLDDLRP